MSEAEREHMCGRNWHLDHTLWEWVHDPSGLTLSDIGQMSQFPLMRMPLWYLREQGIAHIVA